MKSFLWQGVLLLLKLLLAADVLVRGNYYLFCYLKLCLDYGWLPYAPVILEQLRTHL